MHAIYDKQGQVNSIEIKHFLDELKLVASHQHVKYTMVIVSNIAMFGVKSKTLINNATHSCNTFAN